MSAASRLDPELLAIVSAMPGMTAQQIASADEQVLIQSFRNAPPALPGTPGIAERDIGIPTRHGAVKARLYRPEGPAALPFVVNLHGGGWVGGTVEQDHARCRALAGQTPCVVVSLDYSRAPEARFPVALDEAEDAVRWLAREGAGMGCNGGRFALCGSSSGGALAASLAQRLCAAGGLVPAAQVLTYPVCDSSGDYPSWRDFASGYLLSADMMRWFWRMYAPEEAQRIDGEAAPMRAKTLRGNVPTLVVTAECDILRDEAEAYAARLREAGARVACTRYPGMIHGFISVAPAHPASLAALRECSQFLATAFGAVPPR